MDRLKEGNKYLLVEATANQVDQFGGYTGMTPKDYRDFIYDLCDKDDIIANRAAILCKVAEEAYSELIKENPLAIHPVYVVGSEVPIPGGAQEEENHIQVTSVSNFENTINSFKEAFIKNGLVEAFDYVIAVVVQPGVEFGSDSVWAYDRESAKELSVAIKNYDNLVFEAHSTDYQTKDDLKKMVEDGYIILKVGPALTFGFREAAFALNNIEEELVQYHPEFETSKFREILDFVMMKNPKQWKKHYIGSLEKIKFERKYSLSDRCRYYMPDEDVEFALQKLLDNLSKVEIPLPLLSQYMHSQYIKVRENKLKLDPYELLKDKIGEYIDDYIYAIS